MRKPVTAREIWVREDFVGTRADAIRIAQRMNAETDDIFGGFPEAGHDPAAQVTDHPNQLYFNFIKQIGE